MTNWSKAQQIMDHILETVFGLPPDSPLHKTLEYNMYAAPEDFLMETDEDLEDLTYQEDGKPVKLLKGGVGLLKTFKKFVAFRNNSAQPVGENDWATITHSEFNTFHISNTNNPFPV